MRPRLVMLAGVLASASLGAVVSLAGPLTPAAEDGPGLPDYPRPTAVVAEIDSEQLAAFSVLARPRAPSDVLPAAAERAIALGPRADLGANEALSRLAVTRPDGSRVYLVPGRLALCLVESAGVATCNGTAAAAGGQLAAATSTPMQTTRLIGAAPDGVGSATIELSDGTRHDTPVRNNIYVSTERVSIQTVTLASGRRVAISTP